MSAIDSILNVAGILLWLSWRSVRFDPFVRATPATLGGTVRRAEPTRLKRWHFLAALGALIVLRAFFYWQIGPPIAWTPRLDLVFVALFFKLSPAPGTFPSALLFSTLSFVRALVLLHFCLLFLAAVNRREVNGDPFQKLIQFQLGRIGRWPWFVQLLLPVIAIAVLWCALHPLLVSAGVMNRLRSPVHLLEQGLLVGIAVYASLKYLIPAFLLTHLVASYVYLGNSPVWEFVNTTARNLLRPLHRIPLRAGKIDFAPIVGIALVLLVLSAFAILQRRLIWPQ